MGQEQDTQGDQTWIFIYKKLKKLRSQHNATVTLK